MCWLNALIRRFNIPVFKRKVSSPPSCLSWGWAVGVCHRADVYLEMWPGNSEVKWPINLRLDVCTPLHRSHLALLLSSQLSSLWRAVNLSFQEKSSIHPGPAAVQRTTGPAKRCSVQRLLLRRGQQKRVRDHLPQKPAQVFGFTCRAEKHRSVVLSDIKAEELRGDLYAGRVPCQVDPCLYITFSLLWQLLWSEL